jgi:hypothetical protein
MYYTPETLLNHVFEDLQKLKAPNSIGKDGLTRIGFGNILLRFMAAHLCVAMLLNHIIMATFRSDL